MRTFVHSYAVSENSLRTCIFRFLKKDNNMTNIASNEAPKTSAPGESKPAPQQQQSQNPSDKPADKQNEQQK
jgi:hypothetical protein